MWMSQRAYDTLVAQLTEWQLETRSARDHAARLEQSLFTLHALIREVYTLLATREGETRHAQAMADLLAVRVNQLQTERDQLLAHVVPTLQLRTPHIGTMPSVPAPDAMFEDVGAVTAADTAPLVPDVGPMYTRDAHGRVVSVPTTADGVGAALASPANRPLDAPASVDLFEDDPRYE